MINITIPAFDTPTGALTPIVLDALANGATAEPQDEDTFVVRFEDKKQAEAFEAAINAVTNTKKGN